MGLGGSYFIAYVEQFFCFVWKKTLITVYVDDVDVSEWHVSGCLTGIIIGEILQNFIRGTNKQNILRYKMHLKFGTDFDCTKCCAL